MSQSDPGDAGATGERTETTERSYENPYDVGTDAERMAQDGWTILSQTERKSKQGCLMTVGGFFLRSKAPIEHVVTYQRTVQ